eukprot:jgi/Mesvir1/19086/Mv12839-RA.1
MERGQRHAAEKDAKAAKVALEELRLTSECQLARLRGLEESIPDGDDDARWLADLVNSCHPAAAITELGTMLQRTQREYQAQLSAASAARQREEEAWDKYATVRQQKKELARRCQKLQDQLNSVLKERPPSRQQALPQASNGGADASNHLRLPEDGAAPNAARLLGNDSNASVPLCSSHVSRPRHVFKPLDSDLPEAQALDEPSREPSGRACQDADDWIKGEAAATEPSPQPLVISVNSRRIFGQSGGPLSTSIPNPFAISRPDGSLGADDAPDFLLKPGATLGATREQDGVLAEGNGAITGKDGTSGGAALPPAKPRSLLCVKPLKENWIPSFARAAHAGGGKLPSSNSLPTTAPPRFILSGPDGMGGRTKVFRTSDVATTSSAQAPAAKRARPSGSSTSASMATKPVVSRTLEHFFAKG